MAANATKPELSVVLVDVNDKVVQAWRAAFSDLPEVRVQQEIAARYGGSMPVGSATCVRSGVARPAWLISTPTMAASSEDV
ncbi:MAG: macro domain-containing protein, partial [Gemmataceae bacterium]